MLISIQDCVKINTSLGNSSFTGAIHLGAHIGEEIVQYNEIGSIKKVIWIEANKKLFRKLFDHTNRYSSVKQQYLNEVVGDTDGEKLIFNYANDPQCSSLLSLGSCKIHHPQISIVETKEVITSRFDTLCKKYNIDMLSGVFDFVNIDLQGTELKCLKGFGDLLKPEYGIKIIYTEVNLEEIYSGGCLINELDEYLLSFAFKRVITKITEYKWGDACYIRKINTPAP